MRVIEEKMVKAVKNRRKMTGGNTRVTVDKEGGDVMVRLFGNLIATMDKNNNLTIGNCGWTSSTTRSRINALLRGLGYPYLIHQKERQWYLCYGTTSNVIKQLDYEFRETL